MRLSAPDICRHIIMGKHWFLPSIICLFFEEMKIMTNEKPFFKVTLIQKWGLGEETLIFCAIYWASHVKNHISTEGALSGPNNNKGGFQSKALCSPQRFSVSNFRAPAVPWGRGFMFCLKVGEQRLREAEPLSCGHTVGCKVCPDMTGHSVDWNKTRWVISRQKWMEIHTVLMLW